jgi:putative selenate reductase
MRPIPFAELVQWILREYAERGSVFNIRKAQFYKNESGNGVRIFGSTLASPIGPAAGPNSQLAQNIVAAYLAGSRFFELKTVQTMDGEDLRKCVARPCINMVDEGYNVEWSTELTVQEAQAEYIKAWFLLHLCAKEFDLDSIPPRDFAFNMSVGYSYEGIASKKIDDYIEGMKDASKTRVWKDCVEYLSTHLNLFKRFSMADLDAVSPAVSPSVTLSTLHGCPKEEIEKIAAYLIEKKHLHTYIKCNPTLLGYESARRILDTMGYASVSFDEHHFKDDLQFDDAVSMLSRLMALAEKQGLQFGVKITNTFPVDIKERELPGAEMYMSGRSLFPLSISVAGRLSQSFKGKLPISYSGGADFFNIKSILETGIRPVTVASTILKPGGYERLKQLAEIAEDALDGCPVCGDIDNAKLQALVSSLEGLKRYNKHYRHTGARKTKSELPLFDCFKAPCKEGGCPIRQRIPEYLAKVAAGDYAGAFDIIARDNTAPSITGTICNHECQNKCNRVDYDDPLEIRRAKLSAAEHAEAAWTQGLEPAALKTDKTVGVIGAGPAGIAAAVYLRRAGVGVKVYEKRSTPYGIVTAVIPRFRITDAAIKRDYEIALKTGVEFAFNTAATVEELRKKHAFVVVATGAWKAGASPVKEGQENIIDALQFLEQSKASNLGLDLGKNVAVIGGGDVAMDCARAAKRNKGVESVTIVYRRTRDFMPAQDEEIDLALEDGVKIRELLGPVSCTKGLLKCEVTKLGDYGPDGRRTISGTGVYKELAFDTIIGAVGARVDTDFFAQNGLAQNERGFPVVSAANESSIPGVYVAGDCKAGAKTVVNALADSKALARDILQKLQLQFRENGPDDIPATLDAALYAKKGVVMPALADESDAFRCLNCGALCEICVDVCPNRANMAFKVDGFKQLHQIVHFDRMCNECGNCASFCPHAGEPYREKFTVFSTAEDFANSQNRGVLFSRNGSVKLRLEDRTEIECARDDKRIPEAYRGMLSAVEEYT